MVTTECLREHAAYRWKPDNGEQHRKTLRLPEFWVADPVAWFAHVEAHFELEDLESHQHRYFNVIKAHNQDTLHLIKNVITSSHPTMPYDLLKDRLLTKHTLFDFQ